MPSGMKWLISFAVGAGLLAIGWKVGWVLVTIHVLVCFLLIVVVLLQSGKAADLAGAFGGAGSQTAFGPRGAATFLSKATTWCAIMFMLTTVALGLRQTVVRPSGGRSILEQFSKPAPKQQQTVPAPAPQQQTQPQQQPPPQLPRDHPPAKK